MKNDIKKKTVGVIPAAGRGVRLYPRTKELQKTMLSIDGVPIIKRNVLIMKEHLGINQIYILLGHKKQQVINLLGNGKDLGVDIAYIEIDDVKNGLACGLLQLEKYITDTFCVILGDEVYHNSNHYDLLKLVKKDFTAVCAIKETKHPHTIKRNYSVEIENGIITSLIEKPDIVRNNFLGCGTYLFTPEIFKYIRNTPKSQKTKRVELTEVIDSIAKQGNKVLSFMLDADYINVNSIDDYNNANHMIRAANINKRKSSLVIPAYNEEFSIGFVIDDFKEKVDEILVVDNSSKDKTAVIARSKGAKVLTGHYKGYGDALRYGMDNASGDILILTEADGSFFARDLGKILEYLKDADMVLGTRTTKQMIEQAANMNFFLRWGNLAVAKLIELLWLYKSEPRLTDVGCTYRAIWKPVYYEIRDSLKGVGPEFSPEMIIEAMRYNKRIIEIPVTYSGRIAGNSKFSASFFSTAKTALKMLKLIFKKKLLDIL
jgi:dTDP-glucose pyrophosphorylase